MSDTPQNLAKRLLSEGEKSIQFFLGLDREQWERKIYTEGSQWSVRQILAHFVTAEDSLRRLVEDIARGGDGVPEDFDLDSYNERKVAGMEDVQIENMIEQFQQNRERTAELVNGLEQKDLSRMGRHPFLGVAQVVDIIKLIYRHNQIHQREIRKLLKD